jgi:phage gp36-like protein
MAYSAQVDWELAAGGIRALTKLADLDDTDQLNTTALNAKAAEVDAWINAILARMQQALPFNPVPPAIRSLHAEELIYRFQVARRTASQEDHELHKERLEMLKGMAHGDINPVEGDIYPVGDGGGAPTTGELSEQDDDFSREAFFKGGF